MTKQAINVGTTANDKKGDSLRAAFQKVNANFTELYEAVGLAATGQDTALTFLGSTLSTDDSSSIVIDRATTVTSNLSVGGDLLPQTANGGDLGSSTLPWRSLYVSNNTIYIGGTAVGLDANGNLTVNGGQVNAPSSTLVNGANTVSLGSTGTLTFPDGYLKIVPNGANPYISNIIDNGFGLVSGSAIQIRQSVADAYGISINSSTTDTSLGGGASLSGGSNIDVNGTRIILGQYTANYLDANTGLTGQNKIEINNDSILIGLDVSTITNGTTTSAFGGWTFNGQAGTLTFPDATVQTTAWTGIANALRSEGNINIDINLADSTLRRWQFGEDGNLETPGGVQVAGILKIDDGVHEQFQAKVDATGVVTHDCSSGHIFYHTSPDANWTANFTNLNLSATYATSITLIIVQGATGYYPSAVQIAGSAQTINWQGNVNPTVSTSRTDVVTFSVINNAGTYTVLGQLTGF